jgi:hypothetical protein
MERQGKHLPRAFLMLVEWKPPLATARSFVPLSVALRATVISLILRLCVLAH